MGVAALVVTAVAGLRRCVGRCGERSGGVVAGGSSDGRRPRPCRGPRCRAHERVGTLRHLTRAGGGIGRRARFRSVCPYGHGGSSPPSPTSPYGGLAPRNRRNPRNALATREGVSCSRG